MIPHNFRDLVGQRFGKRIVISRMPTPIYNGKKGSSMWLVRCDCGKENVVATSTLKHGKSCGCDTSNYQQSGLTRRSPIPEKIRNNDGHRRLQFGLTPEKFQEMINFQDNRCDVCRKTFTRTPHVDHDHSCCPGIKSCGKCIRGLLCHHCNSALGNLKDDIGILQSAVMYLNKNRYAIKQAKGVSTGTVYEEQILSPQI
jgi:hypothetical protein